MKEETRSGVAASLAGLFPPIWPGVTDQTATGGQPFLYQVPPAIALDSSPLTYSVVGTPPAWLNFNVTTLALSGTPPASATTYAITLRASTGVSGPFTDVTVSIAVMVSPPQWVTLPDVTVASNTANFSLTLPAATDTESTPAQLTYSINPVLLPPGLTFNAGSRTISGTPTAPGSFHITARVTDADVPPQFTERSFVLQVTNQGPTWNVTVPPQTAVRTQAFSFTVPAAVDPEGQALTYRLRVGPAWLALGATSRVLSGTPPAAATSLGLQGVVLEAADPFGATVSLSFNLNVVNLAPTWGSASSLPAYSVPAGSPIDYTPPAAVDPEGEPLTYSLASGVLPPGVALNAANGRITGPSSANNIAGYAVVLRAKDPQGSFVDRSLAIALLNSPPSYVGGISSNYPGYQANPITVMIPYSAFSDLNGGFSLSVEGTTPGLLRNTPAPNPWQPGTYFEPLYYGARPVHGSADQPADPGSRPIGVLTLYNPSAPPGTVFPFQVHATDAQGARVSRAFTITVVALPLPPPAPPPPLPPPPAPPGWPPRSEP